MCPSRSEPLIGSLCSGYGGLDLGVQAALGGTLAWHAEFNPDAARILARHWPGVPNLGDITAVDWAQVPRVCVLTAGFPCQDVSVAGRRAGLAEGTRSGLWHHIARAISVLDPCLVVIENVRGLLSSSAGPPWRPGTLPVVSGRRPRSACCAGTRCRTRILGRPRVRCTLARAACLRRRRTSPPRTGVPRRLARAAIACC
ncbi:hypothetical protein GCM10020295_36840 [Streptomyces cinereospinus]